ncbi:MULTISPECIES: hypothetical protein [unclassified Acidovorax]|uniref:hypothetical protein n=1 Tax=unclassified Acidovorax TaxID=2684926 RepID=UPI0028830E1F|nr:MULTISPECIES: hypothetical protein [unclassified Acidovorax]
MSHLFQQNSARLNGRRPALRSVLAGASLMLLASLGATGAMARQPSSPAPSPASQSSQEGAGSSPATAPLTRAQVIAELECARASGELEAAMLNSYGLPTHQPATTRAASSASCGAAAAATAAAPR